MLTTHTNTTFKTAFMASMGVMAQLIAPSSYAGEASLVATANSNIVVQTTAQASLTLSPSTTVLAGKYTENIILATWSAEVTAGSLALRLNPTIMKTTSPSWGTATSKESSSNTMPLNYTTLNSAPCNFTSNTLSSNTNGWNVCNQGLLNSSGYIRLASGGGTTLSPGTYPLSMDVAVWAY